MRAEVSTRFAAHAENTEGKSESAVRWLIEEVGVSEAAATQIVDYLAAGQAALRARQSQPPYLLPAGRLPGLFADDLPPGRGFGLRGDSGTAHCLGVRQPQ